MRAFCPLLVLIPLCLVAETALAATNTGTRIALHRKATTSNIPSICTSYTPNAEMLPCSQYNVVGPAPGASVIYLVAALADPGASVKGVSLGIDYSGRDQTVGFQGQPFGISPQFTTFTICSSGLPFMDDNGFGDWPKPKGGIYFSWQQCQNTTIGGTVHALLGSFYVYAYSEDVLQVIPNLAYVNHPPELRILDCQNGNTDLLSEYPPELWPSLMGKVHLGGDGSQGYNPCAAVPIVPASWGSMKARFSN